MSLPLPSTSWTLQGIEVSVDRNAPVGTSSAKIARVFKGSWKDTVVAVKSVSESAATEVLLERAEVWETLQHPSVLRVFGCIDSEPLQIVAECHPKGNARQYVAKNPDVDRMMIATNVVSGMQELHRRGIIHGSLKPSNVLIKDDGGACVGDYEMVKVQPSRSLDAFQYWSPEAWKGATSRPSDVYAFAMTALEIFSSSSPWGVLTEKNIYQMVVHEDVRPDRPESDMPDRVWSIIEECWAKDSRLRPNFNIIYNLITVEGDSLDAAVQPLNTRSSQMVDLSRQATEMSINSVPPPYEPNPPNMTIPAPSDQVTYNPYIHGPAQTPVDQMPLAANRRSSSNAETSSVGSSSGLRTPPPVNRFSSISKRPLTGSSSGSRNWDNTPSSSRLQTRSMLLPEGQEVEVPSRDRLNPGTGPYAPLTAPAAVTRSEAGSSWEEGSYQSQRQRRSHSPASSQWWDNQSLHSDGVPASVAASSNAVLLAGALQTEVQDSRKPEVIDGHLVKIQHLASQSNKSAQKLVTAGVIPTLIRLLKLRAADNDRLDIVLITLGLLAHDSISSNTIFRTNTTLTLIEILAFTDSPHLVELSIWCLNRICRSGDIASGLVKQNITRILQQTLRSDHTSSARQAAWCLGSLVQNDSLADTLSNMGVVSEVRDFLQACSSSSQSEPEDVSAALFAVARISRSIKIAKLFSKAGCLPIIAHHLNTSEDPDILMWSARAVGCLMRPNSGDMAKALLEAGVGKGLARVPSILPSDQILPLSSFAFAIQRFSCAEWGGGTRKALVDAGCVDGLLAALRTAADEPYPQVHIDLALAVSFLGDVGGGSIRKEIISAGGIDILNRVAAAGDADVAKTCRMAVTSITGNILTRNAASAKTAMSHNWNGGCPEWLPDCPVPLMGLDQ